MHRQSPGDGHSLAHAPRELVGALVDKVGQADLTQNSQCDGPACRSVDAAQLQSKRHVLSNRQPRIERGLLKDEGSVAARSCHELPAAFDRTAGRELKPRDQIEKRALTAAARPQKNHEFTRFHLEVNVNKSL